MVYTCTMNPQNAFSIQSVHRLEQRIWLRPDRFWGQFTGGLRIFGHVEWSLLLKRFAIFFKIEVERHLFDFQTKHTRLKNQYLNAVYLLLRYLQVPNLHQSNMKEIYHNKNENHNNNTYLMLHAELTRSNLHADACPHSLTCHFDQQIRGLRETLSIWHYLHFNVWMIKSIIAYAYDLQ